ncbi:hypothetical protein NHH62_22800 [Paraburkholderia fungorum]|nr:hypothetical protein NHH62_22800 [Paraburkholderia fungorum]
MAVREGRRESSAVVAALFFSGGMARSAESLSLCPPHAASASDNDKYVAPSSAARKFFALEVEVAARSNRACRKTGRLLSNLFFIIGNVLRTAGRRMAPVFLLAAVAHVGVLIEPVSTFGDRLRRWYFS